MRHLHRSHSRVQSLDLMDDIPLPFQTDSHHLSILVQESPMLSPNPPPSVVVEANGGPLAPQIPLQINTALASGGVGMKSSTIANQISSSTNNVTTSSTATSTTTNVIINNIKTNTTTFGTANMESGVVTTQQQQQHSSTNNLGTAGESSDKKSSSNKGTENNCMKNRHWRTCPELHKAMDGVNYIADHTKKEEESTRVSSSEEA
jgi:nicotinic acetylcholine receptor, invertebrate